MKKKDKNEKKCCVTSLAGSALIISTEQEHFLPKSTSKIQNQQNTLSSVLPLDK